MSDQDIVERLRELAACKVGGNFPHGWDANNWGPPLAALAGEAADTIAALRYDHQRDVEKLAALQRQVDVLERLAGAVFKGDGSFREVTKDLPRKHGDSVVKRLTEGLSDQAEKLAADKFNQRWPEVGTHE